MAEPAAPSPAATAYTETRPPDARLSWKEAEFCVLDFETTGLDPAVDEVISFAALRIADGRLHLDDAHYRHVRPRRMPEAETIRIHGLRRNDLVGAPPLSAVLDELLDALTGRALVAHVAAIEQGFLAAALRFHDVRLTNPVVDTAALAAELFRRRGQPLPDPFGLTPLARTLGLPVHRPHHADGDALTTGQVFLALATHLDAFAPQTVGSLTRAGRRPHGLAALARRAARLTRR